MDYYFLPKEHSRKFDDITKGFKKKLAKFNPSVNSVKIKNYFDNGYGEKGSLKLLYDDGLIDSPDDFKGIYIFVKGRVPIYTGISKGVVKRLIQHTKGHNHHTSSFAYALAKATYQKETGNYERVTRKNFNFKEHVGPAKEFLLSQKIAFMKIEDDYELCLFEIYCAMELKTLMYNNFSTH